VAPEQAQRRLRHELHEVVLRAPEALQLAAYRNDAALDQGSIAMEIWFWMRQRLSTAAQEQLGRRVVEVFPIGVLAFLREAHRPEVALLLQTAPAQQYEVGQGQLRSSRLSD
jgi:hypothetical protein